MFPNRERGFKHLGLVHEKCCQNESVCSNPALTAELIPGALCMKACNEEAFCWLHIHTKHMYYYQTRVFLC